MSAKSAPGREWPGHGQWREAGSRPLSIVFVHNYGGNRNSSRRHQDLVLELGYNCFSFDLTTRLKEKRIPDWADELEAALDAVPGDKVIFSFSFPSVSVPCLLARRARPDVRGWICDGGPFSDIWMCYWRLLTFLKYGSPFKRFFSTGYNYWAAGGPLYDVHVRAWLAKMDRKLPILSIRCDRDPLVPQKAIDRFFKLDSGRPIQRRVFTSDGHLDALTKHPEAYKSALAAFLESL